MVMRGKMRRPSGTSAMRRREIASGGNPLIRSPRNSIVPRAGGTTPKMVLSVVDLPAALPPSRDTISPSRTSSEIARNTRTGP